jgi:drug/metabolite transporter (DMT)-like permease
LISEHLPEPAHATVSPAVTAELERPTNLRRAAAYMLMAALLFALMSVMVKILSHSLPNAMVVFLRSGLALLLLLPAMLWRGRGGLRTEHLGEHIVRGTIGMAAMYCFFFVIAKLGLAEGLLLNYSLPLFIPFVERLWLGEPVPRGIWKPLSIGLLGLIFILKPGLGLFQPAALIGVMGAVFAATAQVGVRRLTRTESVTKIVFYFSIISTLVGLGPALLAWQMPVPASIPVLIALVTTGTVAQLLMTRAYQQAPAAQVGPFIYGSVAFAGLFDWLVFERHPDGMSMLGAILVAVAGILALRNGRSPRVDVQASTTPARP